MTFLILLSTRPNLAWVGTKGRRAYVHLPCLFFSLWTALYFDFPLIPAASFSVSFSHASSAVCSWNVFPKAHSFLGFLYFASATVPWGHLRHISFGNLPIHSADPMQFPSCLCIPSCPPAGVSWLWAAFNTLHDLQLTLVSCHHAPSGLSALAHFLALPIILTSFWFPIHLYQPLPQFIPVYPVLLLSAPSQVVTR